MKYPKKIAIYSGDIPSTTFIERLIDGISNTDVQIFLFGFLKSKYQNYNNQVSVFGYKNTKFHKGLHLLKYTLLLFLFRNKQKSKLDSILKCQSNDSMRNRVKFYPVLWHQPDVFHLQWAKGLEDWIWVQEFGIQLVLSLRGAHINYSPISDNKLAQIYRELFPKVDAFHAVSEAISVEAQKYDAKKELIKVVYSGLDLKADPNLNNSIEPSTDLNIISVGRSHWIKGYSYAIDACKLLKDSQVKFKYTIIGGAEDIELAYQIHDLDLTNEVQLLGQMTFEEVQKMIQGSDLLLLPSLKEGLANVVLEAMSIETLVLSTDCGGMNEIITSEVNGFLIPIRDSKQMAKKIIEISKLSEEHKQKVRYNAVQSIRAKHTNDNMVQGMLELYDSIES